MSSNNNTPRLRFPGFTGDWEEKKLGELTEFKRGTTITAKETVAGNVPVIAGGKTPSYYHNVANRDGQTIAVSGSGAYAGFVSFWEIPVFLSDSFSVETYSELDRKYTYYYMKFRQHSLFQMQKGAGVPHVHGSDVGELEIPLPLTLPEQQKIASCLSEMDNLIAAQGQKVEALKEKKKGLMQQLFPQNGETTPRLRFPGFEGEWEEKKFKDFTFAVGKKNRQNLPYDRYSISNEKGFYPQDEQFEGGAGYLKNIDCKMYIIVPPKSFAYNPARINIGSIGYQNLGKDVIVSSLYEVFQVDNTCDDSFLWHWFHSDVFRKMVLDVQEGGVRQYFFYEKLKECSINLPSKKEQQTIASFLSELDSLISSESNKLENLKNYKKGLMQQLFPQPVK